MGESQHYLPASLIGRFGKRLGQQWRTARIVVRAAGESQLRITSARRLAFEPNLYRLQSPSPGVDPDAIDRIWTVLEQQLPASVERLLNASLTPGDEEILLFYVATCAVRHPDIFATVSGAHLAGRGVLHPTPDDEQMLRLGSIQATLEQVRSWRWRLLRCSPDANLLVVNDKGFCYVGDTTRNTTGLFLPLLPNLGMFGSLGMPERPFSVQRTLTAASVQFVNHILWLEAPRETYGHPDDFEWLRMLHKAPPINALGPFMWRHGGGWFE